MAEHSGFSSSNAILRGRKGDVYEHKVDELLGGSREQLNNEELPKQQPMSKDAEMLALLGYKQGSDQKITCVSVFQRCSALIQNAFF